LVTPKSFSLISLLTAGRQRELNVNFAHADFPVQQGESVVFMMNGRMAEQQSRLFALINKQSGWEI